MKKVLLSVLVIGLVASASNGATLWMQWNGGDSEAAPGEQLALDIWVTLGAGDDLINYFGGNQPAPAVQVGVTTAIAGWLDASAPGTGLGTPGQQVSVGTPGAASPISGGTYLIATQTIQVNAGTPDGFYDITFDHATVGLLDRTGGAYTFGPSLAGLVPHFFKYGAGSPGVADGGLGASVRDPLIMSVVPEPATLALLALGGLAIIRRR